MFSVYFLIWVAFVISSAARLFSIKLSIPFSVLSRSALLSRTAFLSRSSCAFRICRGSSSVNCGSDFCSGCSDFCSGCSDFCSGCSDFCSGCGSFSFKISNS